MEMNAFVSKFLREENKNNPGLFFKSILLFIPVLSIVGMFATAQMVPSINQRSFLRNSTHEWLQYLDDTPAESDFFFRVMDKATVAHIISTSGGVFYRPSVPIEAFLVETLEPSTWDSSYFNNKNVLDGDLNQLSVVDGKAGLALSYNAAKRLKKQLGDEAALIFQAEEEGVVYYPVTIQAILKPYFTEYGGLGFVLVDKQFLNFIDKHNLRYQFVRFGYGEGDFSPSDKVVYKGDQMAAADISILSDQNYVKLIIAAMGGIVVYLLVNREVKFSIYRRLRTIGILSALGATKQTILNIFWVDHAFKIIIASLLAGIFYKYLLMERFLGEYIGLNMWIILVSIYIAVGLLSLKVAMRLVQATIKEFSVPEIISKKPEEL